MTLLLPLLLLQKSDYYYTWWHIPRQHCYFTYDRAIIAIIAFQNYYDTIIAIMTLLLPLLLFKKNMTLLTFLVYDWHYYNSKLLSTLLLSSQLQNMHNSYNDSNNSNNIFLRESTPQSGKRGSDSRFNSRKALVHIRGSYRCKNIVIAR